MTTTTQGPSRHRGGHGPTTGFLNPAARHAVDGFAVEPPTRPRDRGSATAEIALLLPGVVMLLLATLGLGQAVLARLACIDAARAGARLAARGEPAAAVLAAASRAGPPGASAHLRREGGDAVVTVSAATRLPLPGRPAIALSCHAVSPVESPAPADAVT
jgi:hypothetical protein